MSEDIYSKPHNVAVNPEDLYYVERIICCAASTCTRTIVEYEPGGPDTRHRQGLPAELLKKAKSYGVAVMARACDHHGGKSYKPIEIPETEADPEKDNPFRITGVYYNNF